MKRQTPQSSMICQYDRKVLGDRRNNCQKALKTLMRFQEYERTVPCTKISWHFSPQRTGSYPHLNAIFGGGALLSSDAIKINQAIKTNQSPKNPPSTFGGLLSESQLLGNSHLTREDSYVRRHQLYFYKGFFFFFFYKGWAISKAAYTKLGIITCKLHLCTSATVFYTTHLAGTEFSIKPPKVQGGKKLA